jgi:serine/threonine-protein kinase
VKSERWREIEAVFLAALERSPATRQAFLDQACGGDAALRQEVESLLQADAGTSGFKEAARASPGADLLDRLQAGLGSAYRIERELGGGGMSRIFVAVETALDRRVVIKVLRPELAAEVDSGRFQREIHFAARLQHPHLVPVHSAGQVRGLLYYTMPFVEGESLRHRLEREGPRPIPEVVGILREVTDALSYAHRQGVIHRDLKPANILLEEGHALITDFGIAKALSTAATGGTEPTTLTSSGVIAGTPVYMAPEQAAGDTIDARADFYALGCLAYELLTGRPPFSGGSVQELILAHITEKPEPVAILRADVPRALGALVMRLLEKRPADRPQSAGEILRALQAADHGVHSAPWHAGLFLRIRRWPRQVTALAITVLVLLGVVFLWTPTQPGSMAREEGPDLLAVLPFDNLGDSTEAYFVEGLSDAVRGKLAALPELQVIAGTSSAQFRHTAKSPQEVARELGVRFLLVGKARREVQGDSGWVTVSTELVEVRDRGAPITRWQEPLEAPLSEVFRVQADIARGVVEALGVPIGADARLQLARPPTGNLAAYQAFLRGEEISNRLETIDPGTIRRALTYYEQAVALDSSFFEAWVQLSRAHSTLYFNGGNPSQVEAEAARAAAARSVALGPATPEGPLAQGVYYLAVLRDNRRALEQFKLGLRAAPNHVELLSWAGLAEQYLGRWDEALGYFRRAYVLDPRSLSAARTMAYAYLMLRRYPEALAVADRALALEVSPRFVHLKAMIHLAQGSLRQARADIRASLGRIEPAILVATFAYGWDLYWVLEEAEQQLLLRLPPSAFGDNRAAWGLALAQTHALRGDRVRARSYADTAGLAFEEQLETAPDNYELQALSGVALAYAGRKSEAIRAGERAVAMAPITRHEESLGEAYVQHQLVRIYLLAGEPEKALARLEPLLKIPYYLSPGWLRIDPTFDPLRGHPRFERLGMNE